MAEHHNHLNKSYDLVGQDATNDHYNDWAATYDVELKANGYVTPERCAAALAKQAANTDISILDIGCGTGISGAALRDQGFTNIAGCDVSTEMLAQATASGLYQDTWLVNDDDPYPFADGTYDAITAIGVIGTGAAPVEVFYASIAKLTSGGLYVVSLNDHAIADPQFAGAINNCIDSGQYILLSKDYGPHIPGKNLNSNIYVLERR